MNKADKKGPELLAVTAEMLQGVETLAKQYKAHRDEHTYDFLMLIKTALSKYPVIAEHIKEISARQRKAAASLTDSADYIDQLFPSTGSGS